MNNQQSQVDRDNKRAIPYADIGSNADNLSASFSPTFRALTLMNSLATPLNMEITLSVGRTSVRHCAVVAAVVGLKPDLQIIKKLYVFPH